MRTAICRLHPRAQPSPSRQCAQPPRLRSPRPRIEASFMASSTDSSTSSANLDLFFGGPASHLCSLLAFLFPSACPCPPIRVAVEAGVGSVGIAVFGGEAQATSKSGFLVFLPLDLMPEVAREDEISEDEREDRRMFPRFVFQALQGVLLVFFGPQPVTRDPIRRGLDLKYFRIHVPLVSFNSGWKACPFF